MSQPQLESAGSLTKSNPVELKLEPSQIPNLPDLAPVSTDVKIEKISEKYDISMKVEVPVNEASWRQQDTTKQEIGIYNNRPNTNSNNKKAYVGQKSKRYTKTNHTKTSHAFGGQKTSFNVSSFGNSSSSNNPGASELAVLSHTNSVQCLREVHVPLVQYEREGGGDSELVAQQTSDSEVSDSGTNGSNMLVAKCTAKVRIAAFGVLLTAFQVN